MLTHFLMLSMRLFRSKPKIQTALAFDIGTHYIGVAIYRNHQTFSLKTIKVTNSFENILKAIIDTIEAYHPDVVFLGIPRRGKIRKLVFTLRKKLIKKYQKAVRIILVSEDKTSKIAKIFFTISALRQRESTRKAAKKAKSTGKIDEKSALTILQLGLEKMRLKVE